MKRFYRSVWISDVHLCTKDCQAELLYNFLDSIRCDYLYLVGDIIDLWVLKKRWHWPNQYNEVIHKLLKRTREGASIVYIPGNHDEHFRGYVGIKFGQVKIVSQAYHRTADGRRFLVTHGDEFDAVVRYHNWLSHLGSWAYQHLVTVNRLINIIRRRLGLPYWSFSGAIKRRVKQAVKYMNKFEYLVTQEAKRQGVDGVICGHIHQPAMREINGVLYCNTGDWVENCTALVETETGDLDILWWHMETGDRSTDMAEMVRLPKHTHAEAVAAGPDPALASDTGS